MSELVPEIVHGRQVFEHTVKKDGRTLVTVAGIDSGDRCVVDVRVYPIGQLDTELRPGPYTFATPAEAVEFARDTLDALTYLGCDL